MTNNTTNNNDKAKKEFFEILDRAASKVDVNNWQSYRINAQTARALFVRLYGRDDLAQFVAGQVKKAGGLAVDVDNNAALALKLTNPEYIGFLVVCRAKRLADGTAKETDFFVAAEPETVETTEPETVDSGELEPVKPSTLNGRPVFNNGALWQYDAAEYFKKAGGELTNKRIVADAVSSERIHGSREKGFNAETVTKIGRMIRKHVEDGGRCLVWRGSYVLRVHFLAPEPVETAEPETVDSGDDRAAEYVETASAGRSFGFPVPSVVRSILTTAGAVDLGTYKRRGGCIAVDYAESWPAGPSWYSLEHLTNRVKCITSAGGVVGFAQDCGALRVYFKQSAGAIEGLPPVERVKRR